MSSSPTAHRGSLMRVLAYATPHWRTILLVIVLAAVYSAANSLRIGAIGLVLDGVVMPPESTAGRSKSLTLLEDHILPQFPGASLPEGGERSSFESGRLVITSATVEPSPSPGKLVLRDAKISRMELAAGGVVTDLSCSGITIYSESALPGGDPPFEINTPVTVITIQGDTSRDHVMPILIVLATAAGILALLIAATSFVRGYLSYRIGVEMVCEIRGKLFRHLTGQSLGFFQGRAMGDVISRMTGDVGRLSGTLQLLFGEIFQQPLTIFFSLALAFITSWQLTLVVLPFLALLAIPVFRQGKKVRRHGRGTMQRFGEITQTMAELLSGIRVVKSFSLEKQQETEFNKRQDALVKVAMRQQRARLTGRSIVEGLYNLIAAGSLILGGWVVTTGMIDITFGDFAIFIGAITAVYAPLKVLVRAANTINDSLAASDRIFEILDQKPTISDRPGVGALPLHRKEIRFRDLWYRYSEDAPWALRGVDASVEVGSVIALVGPSGSGKSTLLDLLSRFREPTRGQIEIDGVEIREGTIASLYSQLAVVGQDPFLFHTTIRENILSGKPGASDEEVENAARAAAIHEEIMQLPQRYETVIGDRGGLLSGGQRQRVTIARALLKDAPILLLDEATSALDSESEREVQQALLRLVEGRTTFVIAHRLSTIRHADQILVLDGGALVESGTDSQLRASGGLYSRLVNLQESGSHPS